MTDCYCMADLALGVFCSLKFQFAAAKTRVNVRENFFERAMRPDVERLGRGGVSQERSFRVARGHVYEERGVGGGQTRDYALGICLRSEGDRKGTPSSLSQTWLPASKGPGQGGGDNADLLASA